MHDANRHKALLSTRHPCGDIEMLKLQLVYTSFPLFSSLKPPFSQTIGTMWPSSVSGPGLTRRAVSWGTLVCSGVDVYISGRTHCFNLEGHDKHTHLSEAIKMVNTVYDYNENIFLYKVISSSTNLSTFQFLFHFLLSNY